MTSLASYFIPLFEDKEEPYFDKIRSKEFTVSIDEYLDTIDLEGRTKEEYRKEII